MFVYDMPYLLSRSDLKILIETKPQILDRENKNGFIISEKIGSVGVMHIRGVIVEKSDEFGHFWERFGFECSCETIRAELAKMMTDDTIEDIILNIDTFGGAVEGVDTVAKDLRAAREKKNIVSIANSAMLSAGLWIGTATNKVYASSRTTHIGSLGVVALHQEISGFEEKIGVKTTEISAGKFKRIASQFEPLSKEGKAYLQERVDFIYSLFVESIAENRKTDIDTVAANMAEGRVFLGQQAIAVGLADEIIDFNELLEKLNKTKSERVFMDLEKLKAEHPSLFNEIVNNAKAEGFNAGKNEGKKEGFELGATEAMQKAKVEQERLNSIAKLKQQKPGCCDVIEKAAAEGKTFDQIKLAVFDAEMIRGSLAAQVESASSNDLGIDAEKPQAKEKVNAFVAMCEQQQDRSAQNPHSLIVAEVG